MPHWHKNRLCYGRHKEPLNTGLYKSEEQIICERWQALKKDLKLLAIKSHNRTNIRMIQLSLIRRRAAIRKLRDFFVPEFKERRARKEYVRKWEAVAEAER